LKRGNGFHGVERFACLVLKEVLTVEYRISEILGFAIKKEIEAAQMYKDLAKRIENEDLSRVILSFALEEQEHKKKLMRVRDGEDSLSTVSYLDDGTRFDDSDVKPSQDMSVEQAFLLAIKEEKAAFKMYTRLAAVIEDANARAMLSKLAQEEANHKLRFEIEYEDYVAWKSQGD
jgi:rubrerythrin